jgi:nitrogen fixation/metabolism regulation signal transduction histidine kinase
MKDIPIPLLIVFGFILVAVVPFLLVFLFLGVCLGFEKDIEQFFKPDKEET